MSERKPHPQLTLPSLRSKDVAVAFHSVFDSSTTVTCNSRALSSLPGDELPADIDAEKYLRGYFLGRRQELSKQVKSAEVTDLPAVEAFDLFYRSGSLGMRENWVLNRISNFIDNRRVFAVAALLGHRKVMDCFLEVHSLEWFGPLRAFILPKHEYELFARPFAVSAELSAKKVGSSYFLHSGTNYWNRAWLPTTRWSQIWDTHLKNWQGLIRESTTLASSLKVRDFQFLFIPGKDTLARVSNPGVFQSGMLPMLGIIELTNSAPPGSVFFPVKELINDVEQKTRLMTPDSHLAGQDYWLVFSKLIERFGLGDVARSVNVEFAVSDFSGDLSSKFGATSARRQIIELDMPDAVQIYGEENLQVPLRNNHVVFTNDAAPIAKSLLILGDSHSSIGINPFLTYLARHFFRYVEFSWNPFNVHKQNRSYLRQSRYDYLLCETSQRFATPAAAR